MATGYLHTGFRTRYAHASADIAKDALICQEDMTGIALTSSRAGQPGWFAVAGIWNLNVPNGANRGDAVFIPGVTGHPVETASASLTLTETGNTLFGVLETQPDVNNEAHVRLATLTDQHVSSSFAPIIVQQVSPTATSADIIAALEAAGIFI